MHPPMYFIASSARHTPPRHAARRLVLCRVPAAIPAVVLATLLGVVLPALLAGQARAAPDWYAWATAFRRACDTPSPLWEIRSDTATVWLFGSIHFASPDAYPLCPPTQRAFARAGALAVELDAQSRQAELRSIMAESGFLPEGETLAGQLSEENRDLARRLGVDLELYQRFRPWYFAVMLQVGRLMELGYLPDHGLDLHFLRRARARGLEVLELETAAQQLGMLMDLAAMDVQGYVRQTLLELEELPDLARDVFAAWARGDSGELARLVFGQLEEHPEFAPVFERLYFERNRRMAGRIARLLAGDRDVFVVVGVGHLVGPGSVLDELAARGYPARQMGPAPGPPKRGS